MRTHERLALLVSGLLSAFIGAYAAYHQDWTPATAGFLLALIATILLIHRDPH